MTGLAGRVAMVTGGSRGIAGGNGRPRPTEQVEPDEWRRVIEADLTATS